MQGLKWRLSFNSSRPSRQMKKLWIEANVRSDDDDDVDIGKLKSVMIFLDAALCALEQQTQRSVVDELCDDILEIFLTLLLWCKLCQLKIMDSAVHTVSAEDSLLLSEAIMKLLAVAEMLIQTKGTKTSLKELLSAPNASIRYILEALHVLDNLSCKLAAVRILRAITFTESHLLEMTKLNGFRILSAVTRKTNEPALTSQVMHLHRQYMEHLQTSKMAQLVKHESLNARSDAGSFRNRTYSTSSTGSASMPGSSSNNAALRSFSTSAAQSKMYTISTPSLISGSYSQYPQYASGQSQQGQQGQYHHQLASGGNHSAQAHDWEGADDTSIAAKGLNLAFSFVSELLKFAPITADWLNGAGRRDKEALMVDGNSLYYEEQLMLAAMLLSSSVLDIEAERVRQLDRGADHSATPASLDVDPAELKSELSLLYRSHHAHQQTVKGASSSKAGNRGSISPSPVTADFMVDLEAPQAAAVTPAAIVTATAATTSTATTSTATTSTATTSTATAATVSAAAAVATSGLKSGGMTRHPRGASRQSSKEYGYVAPQADPLDYIRAQIQEQDLPSVLMLGIEKAMSPSEALEALLTLQTMLVGDTAAQTSFAAMEGYTAVCTMLLRVEDNLVLLAPCSDSSFAAAAGQQAHIQAQAQARKSLSSTSSVSSDSAPNTDHLPTTNKANSTPSGAEEAQRRGHSGGSSGEPLGLYGSFAKGEFDGYYSHLVMIVMNILLDDSSVHQINTTTQLPFLPARGSEIKNMKAMSVLISMLASSSSGLVTVAVRICFALMKLHAPNVVVLEVGGVVSALIEVLLAILFVGRLDTSATASKFVRMESSSGGVFADLGTSSDVDAAELPAGPGSLKSPFAGQLGTPSTDSALTKDSRRGEFSLEILYAVASDVILLLQIVAVTTANRDNAVVNLLVLLVQQASAGRRSHFHGQRCQNCEMESACLQCLHDGCINDESSMLCQECDNVFHKSTAKKSHIRIPVLDGGTGIQPLTPSSSQEKLNISSDNSSSLHLTEEGAPAGEESCPRTSTAHMCLVIELNEYCRGALVKSGVLDGTAGKPDPLEFGALPLSRFAHDISAIESIQCALLAGIRGILDDREVRGFDKSTSVFRSLLISLRATTVSAPVKPGHSVGGGGGGEFDYRETDSLHLCDLVDYRCDVLSALLAGGPAHRESHKAAPADYLQNPPEITHGSSRRVRLSLLVQCIARFVTSKSILDGSPNLFAQKEDQYAEMSSLLHQNVEHDLRNRSKALAFAQAAHLRLLMLYGADAVLVHLIIDSSAYTQTTIIDRQYVTWVLRETILTATCCKFEHTERLLRWLSWVLRGNSVGRTGQPPDTTRSRQKLLYKRSSYKPSVSTSVATSQTQVAQAGHRPNSSSNVSTPRRGEADKPPLVTPTPTTTPKFAVVPSTAPTIPLLVRIIVLQELRLLMDAVNGSGKCRTAPEFALEVPGFVSLQDISVAVGANVFEGTPGNLREGERSMGGTSATRRPSAALGQLSHTVLSSASLAATVVHNCLFSNHSVRKQLVHAGYVELFCDMIMGDLCSPAVYALLRPDHSSTGARSAPGSGFGYDQSSSSAGSSKDTRLTDLEKEEWWGAFAALCALLAGCDEAKDRIHEYVGIDNVVRFLLMLIEQLPTEPSSAVAMSDVYRSVFNTLIVELCVKRGQFAAPSRPFVAAVVRFPQQILEAPNAKDDTGGSINKLHKLFQRHKTAKSEFSGNRRFSSSRSTETVEIASLSVVSCTYFVHDKTCLLLGHTTKPLPLALSSERFRRAFATTANVSGVPAPAKHYIHVTSRNSLKGTDASEIRSRLSIDGDTNLNLGGGAISGAALMSRRLLRRNYSTASIHSAESDGGRWDADSTGMGSSAQGDNTNRGSFHSYHSLVALSQALTSQAHTPTASVSGDPHHGSSHGAYSGSGGGGGGGHSKFFDGGSANVNGQHGHDSSKAGRQICSVNMEEFPYPPMSNTSEGLVPNVFVPLLQQFEGGQEAFSTDMLVLLHHALLIRAGYSEGMLPVDLLESPTKDDDARCHSRQYSEDPAANPDFAAGFRMSLISTDSAHGSAMFTAPEQLVEGLGDPSLPSVDCGLVLRRHLSLFMLPLVSGGSRGWARRELSHQPAYSRLQLRSSECSELLLAAAVVSSVHSSQIFLLSTLSHLLEGNPYNAHSFVIKPTTCIGLSRLIPSLSEGSQEKVGYLLSQVLRYSLQQPILRELVDVMKRQRSMSEEWTSMLTSPASSVDAEDAAKKCAGEDPSAVSDAKSLLFVMGRTAERIAPETFLHFDQGSPFKSRVELPSIQAVPGHAIQEISVCAWVRVGALADAPTSCFLQLHSSSADLLVDAYFRVVYKLSPQDHRDFHDSSSSRSNSGPSTPNVVNRGAPQALPLPQPQKVTKRVIQLCLSFGKSVIAERSRYENGLPTNDNGAASSAIPTDLSASATFSNSKGPADLARLDPPNVALHRAHWNLAVEQLCDRTGEPSSTSSQKIDVEQTGRHAQDLHEAAAMLANSVCHFSLPDAIVEFDWSELGDWHLLVLGLSAGQLTCSIDGTAHPILHWNPLGYQYDQRSAAIKSATENSMPRPRTLSSAKRQEDPATAVLQLPIGLHDINWSKGFPIAVSLGGLGHEASSHEVVHSHVASVAADGLYPGELGLTGLLQAFEATVAGFCGTVGEIAVLSGPLEEAKVLACLRDGPMAGFRELKSGRLTALTSSALRVLSPPQLAKPPVADTTALTFPSFLSSSSTGPTPTPMPAENIVLNVFSSNYGAGLRERDDLFGKARSVRERELSALKFNGDVQIHQTAALVAAFNAIGGIRALYPLLSADKARLVAALRIIGSLISASVEAYQDFRTIEADKVILYCAVQNPRLVTLETLQVMFELVIESAGSRAPHQNTIVDGGLQLQNNESIHRGALLELLVDIVLSLPKCTQLARSVIDWLREVCDENTSNCQKVLKSPGLLPVLIMLASWDIPGCEQLSKAAKLTEPKKAIRPAGAALQGVSEAALTTTNTGTGASDATHSKHKRERSSSLGSAPGKVLPTERSSQVIDISRAAPHAKSDIVDPTSVGENRVRLMDRVNREFLQKTLNDEQDAAETHALYTERYKLQLSCSRFLRLLISGTSGEVEHSSALGLSLLNTVTEFSAVHVATLLSFAITASSCKQAGLEEGISASLHYARDRERRQRAARIKRLIYGSFSGIPVLRQVDIATSAYWSYSAALVALDALIDATTSALHAQMISLLKSAFPGTTLQSMMLQLMSSGCVEIRERALRILLLSFSNLDGKLDSKQIAYFDRMHGFQCLAVQLSYHSDGCTEAIIQGLLSLIFWQRNKRRISSSNGSDGSDKRLSTSSTVSSVASTEDDEGFFPIKTSTSPINSRPNSMELRRNQLAPTAPGPESAASSPSATAATAVPVAATSTTPNCAVPPASVSVPVPVPVSVSVSVLTTPTAAATATEDVKAGVKDTAPPVSQQHPKTAVADQAPAASSGSLLSLFSWGGSSAATTAPAKSSSAPPALVVVESVVGNSAAKLESKSASSAEYQPGELLATSSTNDLEGAQARSSQGVAVESAVSSPSEHETTEDRTVKSIHQQQHHQADDTRTSVNHKLYLVDVMEVPQALEALFKVLQNSKSIDQVAGTFKVIEQSVTCTSVTTSLHRELSAATNVLHQRNAESFFAQKDWLVWMCDLLVQFSRQAMNAEEHEGNTSVFSLSESESVGAGSYYGGNVDLELSEGESEDSNSLAGDCLSEDHNPPHGHNSSGNRSGYKSSVGSADSLSGRVTAWQQHLVDQYSNPIYTLVRKLLLQDMVSNKPSSVRRWNELFRISMPELNGIQERLLEDLFGVMQNLSEFCEDTNSTLNVLKNIASLLEQALEKADLSLPFCVKVVQALHSLAYNCAPEIRSRIKETSVLEIRKNYVVRCLLDNTQDYYTKVAAISEIASPLQGYISSTDSKPLSDVNVVMMVLGMLVEACEDLEFLLGGVDSSEVMLCESATSTAKGPGMVDDIRFIGSPVPASTSDRVHILFEVLEVLIESAQNCVLSSAECRKCVTKLVSNIPGDAHAHCLAAFLKAFGAKARQSAGGGTTPAGSSQQGGEAGGAAATDMDSTKASTGGGSGGGGGSLSRSNTFTGASSSSTGAQGSYTWWGGWSAAPTTGDATITAASTGDTAVATHSAAASASKDSAVESDIEANRTQDISGQQTPTQNQIVERPRAVSLDDAAPPMNIRSFISWFCSFDQREVQGEFRQRVLTEIRATQRAVDKLREKAVQRYMRHTRQAQERRQKEKAYSSKVAKDALNLTKTASDKVAVKFQKDTKTWVTGLHDKCEAGKAAFNNSFEDRFLGSKSPQKDMRASSQPPVPTYTGVLTDRLKCYLRSAEHLCDEDTAVAAGRGSHTTSSGAASADANSAAVGSQQQQPGQSGSYLATGTLKGKTPEPYDSTAALTDLLTYFQTN